MYDAGKILIGLLIFLILVTTPVWYNLLCGAPAEEPVVQTADVPGKDRCVRSVEYMRARHMELLNRWRNEVVRGDDRFTEGPYGQRIEKSLSNTCLDCHSNTDTFCDRCHTQVAVDLYCWDCHVTPEEVSRGETALLSDGKEVPR